MRWKVFLSYVLAASDVKLFVSGRIINVCILTGSNQPHIKSILRALEARVRGTGREAENTLRSFSDVENERIYTSDPPYAFVACTGTTLLYLLQQVPFFLTFQRNCLNGVISRNNKIRCK